jgi:prepilin-type N-terminal cleavage/methylation domain-containing protein
MAKPGDGTCISRSRGFTLIEMLVTVLLVAVLISLLAPSLGQVRRSAHQVKSLSNLRSHASMFNLYTGDWKDTWPYFTYPEADWTVLRVPNRGLAYRTMYFGAHAMWNIALGEDMYGDVFHDSFYPPSYRLSDGGRSSPTKYSYPCAFIAHPTYWDLNGRFGRHQLQPTKAGDVTYPGHKFLFVSLYPVFFSPSTSTARRSGSTEVAFVDGSARSVDLSRITVSDMGCMARFLTIAPHGTDAPFGLHTTQGVRGIDIR